ncbi:MAG: pro-sigmaK processing inhibitor BofA family protein [Oscillospiraceae bacterium]|nr:pro-sigmaK processing inhibitor BofA family protein [Oscillospiraceae bacterium]
MPDMLDFFRNYFYWILWCAGILSLFIFYLCHPKKIRTFLLGSSTGLCVLFLLHFFGGRIGFSPELNLTNLLTCGIFGIPGAGILLLSQLFL